MAIFFLQVSRIRRNGELILVFSTAKSVLQSLGLHNDCNSSCYLTGNSKCMIIIDFSLYYFVCENRSWDT